MLSCLVFIFVKKDNSGLAVGPGKEFPVVCQNCLIMKIVKLPFVCVMTLVLTFLFFTATAQVILEENFSYPAGDLLTAHGWTAHNGGGTQPITVNNGGLIFTGYPSSGIGNAALADNNGEDDHKTFAVQSLGTVYMGAMVNVVNTAAGYFLHLGPDPISTTFRGRIFMDATNHFGLSVGSGAVTYSTATYTPGTTYLLILKYEIVAGTNNDIVSLYIIDGAIPATEPSTPSVGPLTDPGQSDINPGSVAIRQFNSSQNVIVDGIRVGLSWGDIVSSSVAAPTIQASNISFSSITSGGMTASWTNGDGAKRIAVINTLNSFTNPVNGTDPTANPVYGGTGEQVVYNGSGNSVAVTGLAGNTNYWFRVYEYNGAGTGTLFLTTTALLNPNNQTTAPVLTLPTISSPTATGITNYSAMLGGDITGDGGTSILERGTVWLLVPGVTISDNKVAEGGTSTGIFSHLRGSLPVKSKIYYKAYATNSVGSALTSEAFFFTLADEPITHVAGFSAAAAGTSSIQLNWTTPATGADGYLILQKMDATPPAGTPADATGYAVGNVIGDGTVAAIVTPGSSLSQTIAGLSPATQYTYAIFPFAWDGVNPETFNYFTFPVVPTAGATTTGTGPAVYTWQGPDNGLWTAPGNWTPTRTTPASTDILQFNDGTAKTITGLATETIGKMLISNNTSVNLQAPAARTLTIGGVSGTDLDVASGCSLNLNAVNAITITLLTNATASISGNMSFSATASTAHRFTGADPSSIQFQNGSVFTAGSFFSGNPFGTTSLGSVIFTAGSTFIQQGGSNPFGASQPNSVVVFQAGSLFKLVSALTPSFSGRTYANFEMDVPGATLNTTGGNPVSFDHFTITSGTLNFNMTGPTSGSHQIRGNITVNGTLNFAPSSAGTVKLNGTSNQVISGTGTIATSANSTLEINNVSGVDVNKSITVNGAIKFTSGLLTIGGSDLLLGTTGNFTGTPSEAAMVVATGTGLVKKSMPAGYTGSFLFPVGDNTGTAEYSPVTITYTGGTFGAANFTGVNLVNAKFPGDPNMGSYLNRYWNISVSDVATPVYNTVFQYLPADVTGSESLITCMQVDPLPFVAYDPANPLLHQLTASGLNGPGTFTGSQPAPVVITEPATGITPTNAVLNATVNANNQPTTVTFEYGLTTSYGGVVPGVPGVVSGNVPTPVSAAISGLLPNTTYHFRAIGVNGAGSTYGADLTFTTGCPIPAAAGTISGPSAVCVTGTGYVYSVPAIANATAYNWTVPAGAVITSGANTSQITVSYPAGASSGIISVYGSSICGNGNPSPDFTVTVNPLPVPSIAGPQSPCINATGNIYSTEPGMTGYTWTVSAGGTIVSGAASNSISVTWSTAGPKTVTVSYTNANGCTAASPTVYALNVIALPVPTITGLVTVCAGNAGVTYTTEPGMSNYQWNVSIGGTIVAGAGTNAITVSWPYAGQRSVSVNYTNPSGCTAVVPTTLAVTINPGAVPTIGSTNNPCINSTNNQYITNSGMFSYVWAVSPGGTITSGQGTYQINVTWTALGAQWVSVTYTNSYGCSPAEPTVYNLFVNPVPGAAGPVTGTSQVCAGAQNVAYSCGEILNASSYDWILPSGAVIATGVGTNQITVNFGPGAVSGNVTVSGRNSCGNGSASPAFPVTVSPLPGAAGSVTGPAYGCVNGSGNIYSVPPVPGATGYQWNLPAGAVITSGNNTNQITVTFGSSPAVGTISVAGTNACGNGAPSPGFTVIINPVPFTPVITANGPVLTSSSMSGNQWYYNGTPIPGATGQTYTVTNNSGYYWCVVTLNGCSSEISNKIWIEITGLEEPAAAAIAVFPVPNDGRFTLSFDGNQQRIVKVSVVNKQGSTIYERTGISAGATGEIGIDLRPVPAGVYSVIVLTEKERIIKKIIIFN